MATGSEENEEGWVPFSVSLFVIAFRPCGGKNPELSCSEFVPSGAPVFLGSSALGNECGSTVESEGRI